MNFLGIIKNGTKKKVGLYMPSLFPAARTTYDNMQSDLSANRTQGAIDELCTRVNSKVSDKPTFTEASTRANIASGESFSTILGKIKKFFSDLKTVAFTGSYNDLNDKPTIPTNTNQLTNGAGFITANDTAKNVSGTVAIANGGTGATTAAAARNALGLGNTTGALPIANGGTGQTTAAAARNALGLGNTTGALPIANGGTGATTRLNAVKNLTNEAVSSPGYVIGMTSSWGKFGYTTLAELKTAMSLNNVNNTADANKSVNYANSAGSATDQTARNTANAALPKAGGTMTGAINFANANMFINGNGANNWMDLYATGGITYKTQWHDFKTTAGAWNTISALGVLQQSNSSRRVKENIKDITEDEAKRLLNVRIVSFDYKPGKGFGDGDERKGKFGVIAEEVDETFPYVVNYDLDSNHQPIKSSPSGVNYDRFIPHLIKMVQMQQAEIDELKAEIALLKGEIK